jgi:hypothetical protein
MSTAVGGAAVASPARSATIERKRGCEKHCLGAALVNALAAELNKRKDMHKCISTGGKRALFENNQATKMAFVARRIREGRSCVSFVRCRLRWSGRDVTWKA